MTNYIVEYYSKIESGEIVVSKHLRQMYDKIFHELKQPKGNYVFDIRLASRPIEFIERFCKNSKAPFAGQPVKLMLWQKALIQSIYGFVDKNTKLRRCREAFIICGRKNGKSCLTSGLALYGMIEEKGAQVVCAATKREQALQVFNESRNMVIQSPYLSKHIRKRKSDLYLGETFSSFMPLASESKSLDGLNVSLGILDEIHAIKGRDLYDVILQSQSAREQPLIFAISTAGFLRESLFDNLYEYGCKVLNGEIDNDAFMPFYYELDKESEYNNSKIWIKANPSLGFIKKTEDLKANVERAKVDPTFMPTLLTKDFCIKQTISGSWLKWDELNNTATFNIYDFSGSYGIGGVDLSEVGDLTCATLLLMRKNDDIKYILQHYFIPKIGVEKHIKEDNIRYDIYQQQGLITFCKGAKIDYSDITKWFEDVVSELKIIPLWIYYDRWNSTYWIQQMQDKGFKIMPCGQGFKSVSPVMKNMEIDFRMKKINYNNNQLLKWCLSNTHAVSDSAGNIKFDKGKNRKQRIDGMASLYDAYFGLMENYNQYLKMIK